MNCYRPGGCSKGREFMSCADCSYSKPPRKQNDITHPLYIDSIFNDKLFFLKDGHLIINGGDCGRLCVEISKVKKLAEEMVEIYDVYKGVRF